jgi:hypothetical protein
MKRPSRSRSSKISEAVFRGSRTLYSFEVYPLTAKDITDSPGVFIISRRRTDKFGSGHHNAVCLGETKSILAEIRHHKKAKCVKQTAANVICFLKEEQPEKRQALVDDLAASRRFACIRNEIKAAIGPLPAIVEFKPDKPKRRRVVQPKTAAEDISTKALKGKKGKAAAKKKTTKTSKRKAAAKATKSTMPKPSATRGKIATTNAKPNANAAAGRTKRTTTQKASAKKANQNNARTTTAKRASKTKAATAVRPAAAPRGAGKTAAGKRAKPATAAKAGGRARVSGRVDRDGRQHRLPDAARPAARPAKTRTSRNARAGKKAAA